MALRAIELNGRLADAYINLAGVQIARHRNADALAVLDALLVFAPTHARALAAKALALKDLDRLDEAMDWARRAAVGGPGRAGIPQCDRSGPSGDGGFRPGAGGL